MLDVDTRSLPICWTVDLRWLFPPTKGAEASAPCPICAKRVYISQMGEHIEAGCTDVGLDATQTEQEESGLSMGGDQCISCDVSGAVIDAEDRELNVSEGNNHRGNCMHRTPSFTDAKGNESKGDIYLIRDNNVYSKYEKKIGLFLPYFKVD